MVHQWPVPNLKRRLLKVLSSADKPMDYTSLLQETRLDGLEMALGLQRLEEDGMVTRELAEQGFVWTYDPATA